MFLLLLQILVLSTFLYVFFVARTPSTNSKKPRHSSTSTTVLPKAYPVVGSIFSILPNKNRRIQWLSDILQISPSSTFTLHRLFGHRQVFTANPAVVQHILKTHFPIYQKGAILRLVLTDFLGNGIFNADGDIWKFQRQVSSHEFNAKSLRKFVETVVDTELHNRLIPILSASAANESLLDFQDILQRFAFDNICTIAFGLDPKYLLPSLPQSKFSKAFEEALRISSERSNAAIPFLWKIEKLLKIGSEKELQVAVSEVRGFAKEIVREKKNELREKASLDSVDLLSRFLNSGHSDDDFVIDIVISFILAGRDTTSAALTWFFWLVSKNPHVENEILKEIRDKSEAPVYDDVKDLVYTHAALCESMRLYPPVPVDTKEVVVDDILPEGTAVKKGTRVSYHVYAMGRSELLWGSDWAEFRPERWLELVMETDTDEAKWNFIGKDPFSYPVFQAGPRVCLGKEMAFLQMKRVVTAVLRSFRVVPAFEEGVEPEFIAFLTAKMKGGLPVRIMDRKCD
ncbi:putative Cytochrome P450 [Quillaja saponaria]|uniref:Cytochrome P450 n=1 Tax=Quillaja saponaria TaxID=32244 RepID=A0AAD7QAB4_QUISA|nr:putative Cytochrome P450 [Quillaja saponaria]KAJ7977282.1 putative Cytochrome P450 [Quillaja saponaria]